jgi:uncharacterized Fe-S center protein
MGERSKVWYMDDRAAGAQDSLVIKMLEVFKGAGIPDKIKPGDNVAIKVHMGEWNNTSYLRPVYVRALADEIKRLGAVPFAVDTTTVPLHSLSHPHNSRGLFEHRPPQWI